jgi:patatin-like phospholipase/acyl hydrolase
MGTKRDWLMSKKNPGSFSILSIDGGGILGLYSANMLKHIQEDVLEGEPFSEYFDLITGTSTGGIIGLGLASGHSAAEIEDFYRKHGREIFPRNFSFLRKVRLFFSSKYSNQKLASRLDDFFGKTKVSDCPIKFCVPAIDVSEGRAVVFKTNNSGKQDRDEEYLLKDIALATSAAPTYLPLYSFDCFSALADGGLWQNNPSLIGMIEAHTSFKGRKNISNIWLLSIGNPLSNIKEYVPNCRNHNGLMAWKSRLVTMPMKISSNATNDIMKILLRTNSMNLQKYLRIDHDNLSDEHRDLALDNASDSALKRLQDLSDKDYHNKFKEQIKDFFKEGK